MTEEKDTHRAYIQLHLFREQFKAMAEEKGNLEKRLEEMIVSVAALSGLEAVKKGEEMWSSLGSGAFVRSDIKDTESVLVSIGAGVVVRKERMKALEILKSRLEELVGVNNEMANELEKYAAQINRLEEHLRKSEEK